MAAACLNNFLQACSKRGARSAEVETNVEQGITSLCEMGSSVVTAIPRGGPRSPAVAVQAGAGDCTTDTFHKVVENTWSRQPHVVGMDELVNSGRYPFLCCAVDKKSTFADLLYNILEQRTSGITQLYITHRNRKKKTAMGKIAQLFSCKFAAHQVSEVVEKVKVRVTWYDDNDESFMADDSTALLCP